MYTKFETDWPFPTFVTGKIRYNEPRYNEPSEQRTVLETTVAVRSGQANLDIMNQSVQRTNRVSLGIPKACVVSKLPVLTLCS